MAETHRGLGVWIATCGAVGHVPVAPGTAGALVGLIAVAVLGGLPIGPRWVWASTATVASGAFALGVWAAGQGEKFFGRLDPREVVIDEVVGQMITVAIRPDATWKWLVAGFLLFRMFDVIKPFPARRLERLRGGWGIMLDDVVAGFYGWAALWLLGFALK